MDSARDGGSVSHCSVPGPRLNRLVQGCFFPIITERGHTLRNYRQILLITVGAMALLLLAAVNIAYRFAFDDLQQRLDRQLGERLEGMAAALASSVADDVTTGLVGDEFNVDAYLRVHSLLQTFANGNHLESIEILDTLWNDPFADQPDSLGRLATSLLDEEGQWAVMSGLNWISPTFKWGDTYYRSAAAPIVDPVTRRTVAIIRLEADASYFEALASLGTLSWWIHGSSAVFAVLLMILFLWYARRSREWEAKLLHTEKLVGLGRLAATIAHEIKNPLGIIKATAQRLEKVDDPAKRQQLLSFIPEETDRLNRILTRYLRVASPDSHAPVAIPIVTELPHWMESAYAKDETARGRWTIDVAPTAPIMASPDAPRQIVINLVNNALDVTPEGERVSVTWTAAHNGFGRLTVSDRGPGIPRKQRKRVFEPFYTTKVKGSGLGLYAVQMLVERDGGRIQIEDNPEGGARFVVEWPLVKDNASQTEAE